VNDGPQSSPQQGIGALMVFWPDSETQQDEHNAESGAARKVAPIKTRTASRNRVIGVLKTVFDCPLIPVLGA
jgi:hypothetical protein